MPLTPCRPLPTNRTNLSPQTTDSTQQSLWRVRLSSLLDRSLEFFFPDKILNERPCEDGGACNPDMRFYKGVFLRALASTLRLAPFTREAVDKSGALKATAEAAVKACEGGTRGRECKFEWGGGEQSEEGKGKRAVERAVARRAGDDDNKGTAKVPEEMNALSALLGMLVDEVAQKAIATKETATDQEGQGDGSGSGNGGPGSGSGGAEGAKGDGESMGAMTRVTVGWMLVGLVAAVF